MPAAIGWAIVVLTLIVRADRHPARTGEQLVSQRRMQLLQPEIKEIQRRYKGDADEGAGRPAGAVQGARHQPARRAASRSCSRCRCCSSCTRSSRSGLTNVDPTRDADGLRRPGRPARLRQHQPGDRRPRRGARAVHRHDHPAASAASTSASRRRTLDTCFAIFGFGISILAVISALLQLVQSRMMLPVADPANDDPNTKIQRQTMLFLPLISIVYGGFLPAGLFIYWITATIFSIVQQYLIVGLGRDVPALRLDPGLRHRPHPAIPGGDATATRARQARGHPDRRRQEDDGRLRRSAPASGAVRADEGDDADMSEYQEFTGKTVEEALRLAREEFGAELEDLDFEILTPGSRGVLGHGRRAGPDRGRAARRPRWRRPEARGRRRRAAAPGPAARPRGPRPPAPPRRPRPPSRRPTAAP